MDKQQDAEVFPAWLIALFWLTTGVVIGFTMAGYLSVAEELAFKRWSECVENNMALEQVWKSENYDLSSFSSYDCSIFK